MGLHNLESKGILELGDIAAEKLDSSQGLGWLDDMLATYGDLPEVPFGNEAGAFSMAMRTVRGVFFNSARKEYIRSAELLLKVLEQNKDKRLAIFTEIVDVPNFDAAFEAYTIWKGTLFDVRLDNKPAVFWHPDKDFVPVNFGRIHHTGYSALGRRKRRKETK